MTCEVAAAGDERQSVLIGGLLPKRYQFSGYGHGSQWESARRGNFRLCLVQLPSEIDGESWTHGAVLSVAGIVLTCSCKLLARLGHSESHKESHR